MEIVVPKHRLDPNAKVEALYSGVASEYRTVTTLVRPSADGNRMERIRTYGPPIPRGQGGQVAVLVLGGMETTLAELQYILEAQKEKKFVPQRKPGEIAQMCRLLAERRNELIEQWRKRPQERPRRPGKGLYLPRGYRMVPTREPGFKVLARG